MLKRSDLAMYRVKERRENVVETIRAYEAERWCGFLGGVKGILTFLLAAVAFSLVVLFVGAIFQLEAFIALYYMWGIAAGLIFSQCIRNYKNAEVEEKVYNLKREYAVLTKMSKELYFA